MIRTQAEAEKFAASHPHNKEGVVLVTSDHALWFVSEKDVPKIEEYAATRKLELFRIGEVKASVKNKPKADNKPSKKAE